MYASSSGLRSRRFSKTTKHAKGRKLRAIAKNKEEEEWAHFLLTYAHAHPFARLLARALVRSP